MLIRVQPLLWMALLSSCTCRDPNLEPVATFIRVEPQQIDFGRLVVGQAGFQTVEVINSGKTPVEGTWALEGSAFSSDDGTPTRATVGSTLMGIRCAPKSVGVFDGTLTITLAGYQPIVVPLACEGAQVPECVASRPCRRSSWDLAAGRCVEIDQADGLSCEARDVCLLNATCHAGRCEGTQRDCADGDPCTADTCHPSRGCEHAGPIACPGEGACRVGRCNPGVGCELVDAEDGIPCGQLRTCIAADVCVSGACVRRDPPDGFECIPSGPCGDAGYCVNDVCEPARLSTLQPTWRVGDLHDGGLPPPEAWSDLFSNRDGDLTLSSYFFTPTRMQANRATPINLASSSRRCIDWLGWVVCGDMPVLTAVDAKTGQLVWTYSGVP